MNDPQHQRLQPLSSSGFAIADGQPNICGWPVTDNAANKIGTVIEIIFDADARKVRYAVVDLEGNALALEPRRVLLPIGLTLLHAEENVVILPDINGEQLLSLPEYDKSDITLDTERRVAAVFRLENTTTNYTGLLDADFYNTDLFNDNALHRKQLSQDLTGTDLDTGTGHYNAAPFATGDNFTEHPVEEEMTMPVNHHSLDDVEELKLDDDSENENNKDTRP